MKYIIYRFPDVLEFDDDDIHNGTRKEKCCDPHLKAGISYPVRPELAAIEYGSNIYNAADSLIRAVIDELSSMEEFSRCTCDCYPPDQPHVLKYMSDMDFDYEMHGVVYDYSKTENTIIYFGVKEVDENQS